MKKFLLSFGLVIALFVVSASASENVLSSEMKGDNVLPYFTLNGQTAFCLESEVEHPVDGTTYKSAGSYTNNALKGVILNYEAMKPSVDIDSLNRVMQQVLWDVIDGTQSRRNIVARRMGPVGIQMYDELMVTAANLADKYVVNMTMYETEDGEFQRLMNWNVSKAKTSIVVEKVWDDDNNRDGFRPESVEIALLTNGVETDTVILNSANNWSHTFVGLDKYDDNFVEISYEVSEVVVTYGYVSTVEKTSTGFIVTNSYVPCTLTLTINKQWDDAENKDGIRPDFVTVRLLGNNEVIEEFRLSEDNAWTAKCTTYQYMNGEPVAFHVEEDAVEGYKTSYMLGNRSFTVVNTHMPAPEEPVIPPVEPETPEEDAPVLDWNEPAIPEVEPTPVEPEVPEDVEIPEEPDAPVLGLDEPVSDVPQTGDNSNWALWITLCALSGAGLVVMLTTKKKANK